MKCARSTDSRLPWMRICSTLLTKRGALELFEEVHTRQLPAVPSFTAAAKCCDLLAAANNARKTADPVQRLRVNVLVDIVCLVVTASTSDSICCTPSIFRASEPTMALTLLNIPFLQFCSGGAVPRGTSNHDCGTALVINQNHHSYQHPWCRYGLCPKHSTAKRFPWSLCLQTHRADGLCPGKSHFHLLPAVALPCTSYQFAYPSMPHSPTSHAGSNRMCVSCQMDGSVIVC